MIVALIVGVGVAVAPEPLGAGSTTGAGATGSGGGGSVLTTIGAAEIAWARPLTAGEPVPGALPTGVGASANVLRCTGTVRAAAGAVRPTRRRTRWPAVVRVTWRVGVAAVGAAAAVRSAPAGRAPARAAAGTRSMGKRAVGSVT